MFHNIRLLVKALACAPIRDPLKVNQRRLPESLQATLAPEFSNVDLRNVVFEIEGPLNFIGRFTPIRPVAVTIGMIVFIEPGRYQPDSDSGFNLIVHELTHVEQYCRYGAAGFLTRYFGAYLVNRMKGMPGDEAYRAIPLEIEARRREERIVRNKRR